LDLCKAEALAFLGATICFGVLGNARASESESPLIVVTSSARLLSGAPPAAGGGDLMIALCRDSPTPARSSKSIRSAASD
jgi:hypothetical protein